MCIVVVETQSFIGNDVTLCTLGKKGSFLLRWSLNAWRINSTQKLFVLLIVASWELPIGLTGYHSNIIVLTIFWEKRFVEQTCLLLDSMYLSPPNISARLARVLLDPFPDRCIFLVILLIWQGITSLYALNHLHYLNTTEPATDNRSRKMQLDVFKQVELFIFVVCLRKEFVKYILVDGKHATGVNILLPGWA